MGWERVFDRTLLVLCGNLRARLGVLSLPWPGLARILRLARTMGHLAIRQGSSGQSGLPPARVLV